MSSLKVLTKAGLTRYDANIKGYIDENTMKNITYAELLTKTQEGKLTPGQQ